MTKGNPARDDAAGLQKRLSFDGDPAFVDPKLPSTQEQFARELTRLKADNARVYSRPAPWAFRSSRPPLMRRPT